MEFNRHARFTQLRKHDPYGVMSDGDIERQVSLEELRYNISELEQEIHPRYSRGIEILRLIADLL